MSDNSALQCIGESRTSITLATCTKRSTAIPAGFAIDYHRDTADCLQRSFSPEYKYISTCHPKWLGCYPRLQWLACVYLSSNLLIWTLS